MVLLRLIFLKSSAELVKLEQVYNHLIWQEQVHNHLIWQAVIFWVSYLHRWFLLRISLGNFNLSRVVTCQYPQIYEKSPLEELYFLCLLWQVFWKSVLLATYFKLLSVKKFNFKKKFLETLLVYLSRVLTANSRTPFLRNSPYLLCLLLLVS